MRLASLHYRALRYLLPRGIKAHAGPDRGLTRAKSTVVNELLRQSVAFLPAVDHTPFVQDFLQRRGAYYDLGEYFRLHEMRGEIRSTGLMADGSCILTEFACQKYLVEIVEEFLCLPARRIAFNVTVDALFKDKPYTTRADGYDGATAFHRDVDAWRWLKVFVYLTDVDKGSGHHEVFRGSHLKFPAELREIRRYSLTELEQHFGPHLSVTGPAGTCFAENTLAFHRGTTPIKNSRLMLTAVYFDDSVMGIHPGMLRLV
jgi:hypothetical protein